MLLHTYSIVYSVFIIQNSNSVGFLKLNFPLARSCAYFTLFPQDKFSRTGNESKMIKTAYIKGLMSIAPQKGKLPLTMYESAFFSNTKHYLFLLYHYFF